MRNIFRRYLFVFLIIFIAAGTLVTFGYSDFIFTTEAIPGEVGNSAGREDITQHVDPIRQNTIFGELGDTSSSGTEYYDVYFFAQAFQLSMTGTNVNLSSKYHDPDNPKLDGKPVKGAFYDSNGNILADNTGLNFNRYFVKFENVSQITYGDIDRIGEPKTYQLYDEKDTGYWSQDFLCWASYSTLTKINTNPSNLIYNGFWSQGGVYRVNSYYPASNFEPFYFNELLSATVAENPDIVYTINGRKSIILMPVYTVGKNEIVGQDKKDEITLFQYDTNDLDSEPTKVNWFTYDDEMTNNIKNNNINNVQVFRYSNLVFDANQENIGFTIKVDANGGNTTDAAWGGDKHYVPNADNNTHTDSSTMVNGEPSKDNSSQQLSLAVNLRKIQNVSNVISGRYNIYVFSKMGEFSIDYDAAYSVENEDIQNVQSQINENIERYRFTNDETTQIRNHLSNNNINIVGGILTGSWYRTNKPEEVSAHDFKRNWIARYKYECSAWVRCYYICLERVYTPKATTETVTNYNSSSYEFFRVQQLSDNNNESNLGYPTSDVHSSYIARNVRIENTGLNNIENPTQEEILQANNQYYPFDIRLTPNSDSSMNITYHVIDDSNIQNVSGDNIPTGWPFIEIKEFNNTAGMKEPYRSNSILKVENNQLKVKPGIYSLYIDIIYGTPAGGKIPADIYVYAYQFENIFINLYNSENNVQFYQEDDPTIGATQGYLTTGVYDYRIDKLQQGHYLDGNEDIYKLGFNSPMLKNVTLSNGTRLSIDETTITNFNGKTDDSNLTFIDDANTLIMTPDKTGALTTGTWSLNNGTAIGTYEYNTNDNGDLCYQFTTISGTIQVKDSIDGDKFTLLDYLNCIDDTYELVEYVTGRILTTEYITSGDFLVEKNYAFAIRSKGGE